MNANSAKTFGWVVYCAAVALATMHNINLYSQAASSEAARLFSIVGALFVGLHGLAMPQALHAWAVSGAHRVVAIVLYGVYIVVLSLNVVVNNSLATGLVLPTLLQSYLIYAPATFMLPLATWGILFILDPKARVTK